jgi:hypothetical protein
LAPSERLSVGAAPHRVAELQAVHGVLAAARAELAAAGSLGSNSGYPRLVIEVLRVDEVPEGIVAIDAPADGRRALARGASVGVTARGLVVESAAGEAIVDTGDIRRTARFAASDDPRLDGARRESAVRSAARATGQALARRALGLPEPSFEPL